MGLPIYIRREKRELLRFPHLAATRKTDLINRNSKPVKPNAASVLCSLIVDSSASSMIFDEWCSDFGYDTDSRKALETYMLCQQIANKVQRLFGHVLKELREILSEY